MQLYDLSQSSFQTPKQPLSFRDSKNETWSVTLFQPRLRPQQQTNIPTWISMIYAWIMLIHMQICLLSDFITSGNIELLFCSHNAIYLRRGQPVCLGQQGAFKSSALWCVRAGKGLSALFWRCMDRGIALCNFNLTARLRWVYSLMQYTDLTKESFTFKIPCGFPVCE